MEIEDWDAVFCDIKRLLLPFPVKFPLGRVSCLNGRRSIQPSAEYSGHSTSTDGSVMSKVAANVIRFTVYSYESVESPIALSSLSLQKLRKPK